MILIACKRVLVALATVLTLGLFSACGGDYQVADGGIRGTGSSVGPVSGFGSVFVNGVEFFTDGIRNREVQSNDGVATENDLNEGMILRIEGEWQPDGTGDADSMEYDDTLRGKVSNLQMDASGESISFEIYRQKVIAGRQTVLKNRTLATLAEGDYVRISAWRQSDGNYRASYIGFNPASYGDNRVELEGPVDVGSVGTSQFTMNGVVIKFDDRSFVEGLSAEDLKPGVYFEVEGSEDSVSNTLIAKRIQIDDFRRYRPAGEDIEIAGPVSSSYNEVDQTFGLNGLVIQITQETEWDDLALKDLKEGLLVQVEGEFVSGRLVRATEIEIRDGNAEVAGTIDAVDLSTDSFLVGGVRVSVTPRTIITDDDTDEALLLSDLIPGVESIQVEVSGLQKEGGDGEVYLEALQVERELEDSPEDAYQLVGVPAKDGLSYRFITILGVSIRVEDDAFEDVSLSELETLLKGDEKVVLEVEYKRKSNSMDQYEASSVELE
ncbi:DUF5666 domain-containing protein [Marinobacter salexigens]|uniref:DUF5666 domain-containing protein n=1 Tax=Marinobacter salexigens TaxID=1925763 RepID=A0ABS6A5N6_9GAMM|nr:DUF5666 domain-containing protein [Marinobacter salexigens]MBU2873510.1 hypothetical protein [Marinobacter salexigens]